MTITPILRVALPFVILLLGVAPLRCQAAEVVIVADNQLRPVVEITSGIRKSLSASIRTVTPAEVRGGLRSVVEQEEARVVIALGRESLQEALQLPTQIPVIFGLVVTPPKISRPNTTGFYMAIPARQYLDLISSHLRSIQRVAVIGSQEQLGILANDVPQATPHRVRNSYELVEAMRQMDTDAVLLLPDVSMLTATAMEEAYLLSFRKKVPLLGISERQVKQGALMALVVDTVSVGRMIGEYAVRALRGASIGQIPPSPPRRFDLFLNTETARKMGITIPGEMLRLAKRAYP